MDNLPVDTASIVSRAKGILTAPDAEWAKVATETDQPMQVFLRYALPLIIIGPVASFIGMQVFGLGAMGVSVRIGLVPGITIAVVSLVMAMVSLWVMAWVANMLSPNFGGKSDFASAFRLMAYSYTAAWLAQIFGIVPMLSILGIVGLYSFYLLYKGVTPVMGVPQEKAVGYTVVTVLVGIVAMFVASLVVSTVTGPMMVNAAMSSASSDMSIDLGDAGSIQTSQDGGTMTITGPNGEEATITVNDNK
ncbi:MAG: YIP1 family protein [Erythrobacter sp.]|nr:YIP1 family protein [Erythrobacter sp.]